MKNFLSLDSPLSQNINLIYKLLILNIIWIIFSLPVITIGASTTALFYVIDRIIKDKDYKLFKEFWYSFKLNFKIATLVWIIIAVLITSITTNLNNLILFGLLSDLVLIFQYFSLVELIIVSIYIFPIIAKYDIDFFSSFKISFLMGNKYFGKTFLSLLAGWIIYILLSWSSGFILISFSLYILFISYLIKDII